MRKFPPPIQNLAAAFCRLPGVGPKTALRYVFAVLKFPRAELDQFSRLLRELADGVGICSRCLTYTEGGECDVCRDPSRDPRLLCVVETPRDISTVEATGAWHGRYFVLGGVLNPIEGATPETLNTTKLFEMLSVSPMIEEIVLAFSPDMAGEATMMYLVQRLKPLDRRVTRLARGLPTGASLEYADEVTLGEALTSRRDV